MRNRLIEILKLPLPHFPNGFAFWCDKHIGELADALIAKGVIVQPCKLGDTVYVVIPDFDEVKKGGVTRLEYDMYRSDGAWIEASIGKTCFPLLRFRCSFDQIGKTVFLTREEAEQALREVQTLTKSEEDKHD